jgi:hypothetical protein
VSEVKIATRQDICLAKLNYEQMLRSYLIRNGWDVDKDNEWSKGENRFVTDEEAFYIEAGE